MVEAATVFTDTAAQHQSRDTSAIQQVGVIPVVDTGTDDDRALAFGGFRRRGPLAGELGNIGAVDASKFFLPGRSISPLLVIVTLRILPSETAINAELSHQQIKNGGHRDSAVSCFQILNRDAATAPAVAGKIIKADL